MFTQNCRSARKQLIRPTLFEGGSRVSRLWACYVAALTFCLDTAHQPGASVKANIVVWIITVAAFLGTLVAGVLALFLFSQRDQIREALKTPEQKRKETRTLARVEVELLSTKAPVVNEIILTQNVSRYGARVVTKTQWRPNDDATVKLVQKGLSNRARIAYCSPVKGEAAFAVGLQFYSPVASWTV